MTTAQLPLRKKDCSPSARMALGQQPALKTESAEENSLARSHASFLGRPVRNNRLALLSPCNSTGRGRPGPRAPEGVCRGPGGQSAAATFLSAESHFPASLSQGRSPAHSLINTWPGDHQAHTCTPTVTERLHLPECPALLGTTVLAITWFSHQGAAWTSLRVPRVVQLCGQHQAGLSPFPFLSSAAWTS